MIENGISTAITIAMVAELLIKELYDKENEEKKKDHLYLCTVRCVHGWVCAGKGWSHHPDQVRGVGKREGEKEKS